MQYLGSKTHKNAVKKGGEARAKQLTDIKLKNIQLYNQLPNRCIKCSNPFTYEKRRNKFCSNSCAASYNNTGRIISEKHRTKTSNSLKGRLTTKRIIRKCLECNATFIVKETSKREYCRTICYQRSDIGRDKARETGKYVASKINRRSKNEMYFADLCKEKFSILENEQMFNGWDADVIIPSFKIAILWNGNWHRKKITKKHSVKQVQNRDRIKHNEIVKAGYTPYIIEDFGSHDKEFVEKEFDKFVEYIQMQTYKKVI